MKSLFLTLPSLMLLFSPNSPQAFEWWSEKQDALQTELSALGGGAGAGNPGNAYEQEFKQEALDLINFEMAQRRRGNGTLEVSAEQWTELSDIIINGHYEVKTIDQKLYGIREYPAHEVRLISKEQFEKYWNDLKKRPHLETPTAMNWWRSKEILLSEPAWTALGALGVSTQEKTQVVAHEILGLIQLDRNSQLSNRWLHGRRISLSELGEGQDVVMQVEESPQRSSKKKQSFENDGVLLYIHKQTVHEDLEEYKALQDIHRARQRDPNAIDRYFALSVLSKTRLQFEIVHTKDEAFRARVTLSAGRRAEGFEYEEVQFLAKEQMREQESTSSSLSRDRVLLYSDLLHMKSLYSQNVPVMHSPITRRVYESTPFMRYVLSYYPRRRVLLMSREVCSSPDVETCRPYRFKSQGSFNISYEILAYPLKPAN